MALVFYTSTPIGVATGITSLAIALFGAGTGVKTETVIRDGINGMSTVANQITLYGSRYDRYQIRFPFLEYTLQDGSKIRFISGNGVVERAHTGNGWEILD
ncbi:hypothetical protein ACE41H_24950 [Paenibacillus enshidis]|uniref:Uncharacterized protein n=1 Tax=Paenibacillus enshidis TaxID=1458439 RepID=A0ABV5B2V2_9BACL